ncbi:hypothetical protein [Novibacillus thermophilus]|jgi:hypothetical protein|uniref:Uncharacterized protein n=1 Tax=Novibacillus thermophilus TaxID=1471761 RepID=A0A1U9K376_9BACL|nr:hypothetical protein [Novibacillus thermophilus]AQS54492.1 hypothetical protein B0W44_00455 [Novibacillus thermophilus]
MFRRWYVSLTSRINQAVQNERGAQALEWIALGMLVLAIMGAIAATMEGDTQLGQAVKNSLSNMINSLSEGGN